MSQLLTFFSKRDDFDALGPKPTPVITGRDGIDLDQIAFFQISKISFQCLLVPTVNRPGNILHAEDPKAPGFCEQGLLFRAKPEPTDIDRDALARAPGPVFLLARSVRFMVWFLWTFGARLCDIVGVVFQGALLQPFQVARNRRLWRAKRFNL